MKAFLTLQFDRPVIADYHYLCPGGYAVKTKKRSYEFDFFEDIGTINKDDPTLVNFECKGLDPCFKDIEEITDHLNEVIELKECFCYTGETEDPEIHLVKVVEFAILDYGNGTRSVPESTPWVQVEDQSIPKHDYWEFLYRFTSKLLDPYNRKLEVEALDSREGKLISVHEPVPKDLKFVDTKQKTAEIQITYSWGGAEDPIWCADKDAAWEKAKEMALKEVEIAGIEYGCETGLLIKKAENMIVLHYLYDDTYCYYKIL